MSHWWVVEVMADNDNKEDGEGKHAEEDPAQGDAKVPEGTPITPQDPQGDGKHEK
jgi:hypothetical protein